MSEFNALNELIIVSVFHLRLTQNFNPKQNVTLCTRFPMCGLEYQSVKYVYLPCVIHGEHLAEVNVGLGEYHVFV